MIFGEIGFQEFNLIFKIKILKSMVNTGLHRVGQILIKSEKSQKCLKEENIILRRNVKAESRIWFQL